MRERLSARRRLELRGCYSEPANPADYGIKSLNDIPRDARVITVWRVSSCQQNKDGNLDDQERCIRKAVEKHGNGIVSTRHEVASGWELDPGDRLAIELAVEDAERDDAVLVFESLARILRNWASPIRRLPVGSKRLGSGVRFLARLRGVIPLRLLKSRDSWHVWRQRVYEKPLLNAPPPELAVLRPSPSPIDALVKRGKLSCWAVRLFQLTLRITTRR